MRGVPAPCCWPGEGGLQEKGGLGGGFIAGEGVCRAWTCPLHACQARLACKPAAGGGRIVPALLEEDGRHADESWCHGGVLFLALWQTCQRPGRFGGGCGNGQRGVAARSRTEHQQVWLQPMSKESLASAAAM